MALAAVASAADAEFVTRMEQHSELDQLPYNLGSPWWGGISGT
jgi:hypothetical protein